ncbi:MAG: type II toxin-antitoxin system VapC family toxin [Candidatus Heimdallarchaeaceae archaeon]
MFLVDTNVFLEILLEQNKKDICKSFLDSNIKNGLNITDFSLHSIGVILFKYHKQEIYSKFLGDILVNINLISLPLDRYNEIITAKNYLNLDFDDLYQYTVAKYYQLKIVTMDKGFEKIKELEIEFL